MTPASLRHSPVLLVLCTGSDDSSGGRALGDRATQEVRRRRGLEGGDQAVPLTRYQTALGRLLAKNRSEDSYLAGGAAILLQPNTQRCSQAAADESVRRNSNACT